MKKNICEVSDCNKTATRRIKNGHRVCEDCLKKLKRNHKVFGHNVFFKEKRIGTMKSVFGRNYGLFIDIAVKYA